MPHCITQSPLSFSRPQSTCLASLCSVSSHLHVAEATWLHNMMQVEAHGKAAIPPEPPASQASTSLANAFTPCYPKSEAIGSELRPLPTRPFFISDDQLCRKPISAFDEQLHEATYNSPPLGGLTSQPDGLSDPYLMPSLARNERLRLTMLWYYTRGLYEDREFLQLLQEKVDFVQTFMEWEFAILGLVTEDVFTRVVTSGLPLAVVPRRESTCSHTINQEPGVSTLCRNCCHWYVLKTQIDCFQVAQHGQRLAISRVATSGSRRPPQLRRSTTTMSDSNRRICCPWISLRRLEHRKCTNHSGAGSWSRQLRRHARHRYHQPFKARAPTAAQ